MTKPWNTPEWKDKREKLIEGKSCEWCGSKETLAIHHIYPEEPYLVRYKKASLALLEELIKDGVYEPINKIEQCACPECGSHSVREFRPTRYRCLDCSEYFSMQKRFKGPLRVSKEDFADFREKHTLEIKEFLEKERQRNFEKYMTLENTMILCRKCHMAIGKGLVLCKECKQRYHKSDRDKCWSCFGKTKKGQEIVKGNELADFVHPWCRKIFKVERKFLKFEQENPGISCYPHCREKSFSCDMRK